jgi:uncharacterized membrane protein HdeD (DUF308 family)
MLELFSKINRRINHLAWVMLTTGIFMLFFGAFILIDPVILHIVVSLVVIFLGFSFSYSAWKLWHLKEEIERHLNIR